MENWGLTPPIITIDRHGPGFPGIRERRGLGLAQYSTNAHNNNPCMWYKYIYMYWKRNNSPCRTQNISLKEHIGDNTTLEPIPLRTTTMKHINHKTTIKVITQMARVIRKLSRDSTEYAQVYTETYTAITPYNH